MYMQFLYRTKQHKHRCNVERMALCMVSVWKAEVNKAVSLWIKRNRYRHDITPESVSYNVWRTDGSGWKV